MSEMTDEEFDEKVRKFISDNLEIRVDAYRGYVKVELVLRKGSKFEVITSEEASF